MKIERFRAADRPSVMIRVREALGPDAVILSSGPAPGGGIFVAATEPAEVDSLRRQLEGTAPPIVPRPSRRRIRPQVVALVGPSGGGKTTAMMKLALNSHGFGRKRVGLLTLDSYGVAAFEEIHAYARVTEIPVEIIREAADAEGAISRMRDREVIIVDTPGRLSAGDTTLPGWIEALRALEPDEVHLVCPAGYRVRIIRKLRWLFERCKPTHLLLTRLEESLGDVDLLETVRAVGLPARWGSSGHEIPEGIDPALPAIMDTVAGRVGDPIRTATRTAVAG
jgi:flagellar biosynthesis protein FlhF